MVVLVFQVQTNFEQIAETKFAATVAEADSINHVVVFLTGTQPFPDQLGGSGKLLPTSLVLWETYCRR